MTTPQDIAPGVRSVPGVEFLPRSNFFAETDFITTNPATGVSVNRMGTRMCALTNDFLLGLRNAITHECGPAASEVLRSAGVKWGIGFAKRFESELGEYYGMPVRQFPMAMFIACLTEAFSHHGWGHMTLDLSMYDRGLVLVEIRNAVYADMLGQSDTPVDSLTAGVLAGFFTELTGQDLGCLQTECSACGHSSSRFVVTLEERLADFDSWPAEGKSHAEIVAALKESRV